VARTQAQWNGTPDADGRAQGWPSWAFENHDAPRHISRWVGAEHRDAYARMTMALLMALRGNAFLYQGQELGLTQDDIPFHLLQDPEAIANWPLTLSRDGVRTPMPWQVQDEQGGFTKGSPWLPLSPANIARAVDRQEADPQSQLAITRQIIALRRAHRALAVGAMEGLRADGDLLTFTRREGARRWPAPSTLAAKPSRMMRARAIILALNGADARQLPPYAARFVLLA
jgi:alpha-glucosidase